MDEGKHEITNKDKHEKHKQRKEYKQQKNKLFFGFRNGV
jgi:hypothetical protein